MADKLTPAQEMAASHRGGPILVSAAAGSGKTKVLVERLIRQILRTDTECSINDFLIITFTKKAAAELRTKIAKELAERLAEQPDNVHLQKQQSRIYLAQISTIHSFCGDLIREFAYELDVPSDFRMIEERESAALKQQIADELLNERYEQIDAYPGFQTLVDGIGAGRDDRKIQKLVLDVYKASQCRLYPERWFRWCREQLDVTGKDGAEQTAAGAYLIRAFHKTLSREAENLHYAMERIGPVPSLEKCGGSLTELLGHIERLSAMETWDELYEAGQKGLNLSRYPSIRKCEDPDLKDQVKAIRDRAKDQVQEWLKEFFADSASLLADLSRSAESLRALFDLTLDFEAHYTKEKLRLHALDFNDLEHQAVRLLLEPDGKTPTRTAELVSARYREILVDEYQDTNEVQDNLFRAISRDGKNRFMVGDVKQSIYRFRLADPTIFLDKYNTYPEASPEAPDVRQKILLSHNFRSGPAVLAAVNAVFELCMSKEAGGLDYGPAEMLQPGLTDADLPYPQVELHCISTKQADENEETPEKNRAEAEFAAERIREILADENCQIRIKNGRRRPEPGDIAILLRSPKNAAAAYVNALEARGIPAVTDTGESILDSAEVETLICLLKVLDNVHRDVPLAGAMLSPIFGVSGSALSRAKNRSGDQGLYDAIAAARDQSPELEKAVSLLEELRELARTLPLHRLIEEIRERTAVDAVYGAMNEGRKRRSNLRQFYELAATFSDSGRKSLHQFLDYLEQLRADRGLIASGEQTNAVSIMSIHKSKGLEFPVVMLSGLSKEFNLQDMKEQVQFHSDLGAGSTVYDPETHSRYSTIARSAIMRQTRADNISEEMRILYVAMTRAQDLLIMTWCGHDLDSKLTGLAKKLTRQNCRQLAAGVNSMGDWILMTAMLRTEAGELHAHGGKPAGTEVSDSPWVIRYHSAEGKTEAKEAKSEEQVFPVQTPEPSEIRAGLEYRYPWQKSVGIPSKVTATQLKGRILDEEAAERSPVRTRRQRKLRKPSLMHTEKKLTPAQRGTVMHLAMQYLDFDQTGSLEEIEAQLRRMEEEQFLTPQQIQTVDPEKLFRVFRGELGEAIRQADRVVREFKFSLLTDASIYSAEVSGEKLMLQGVTDCCLIKDGGITVIDFKTDQIEAGKEAAAAKKYRPQLEAYSLALERIFELPVTTKALYFFATDAVYRF